MSNIPSLPDLETDEISLGITESFRQVSYSCDSEENPGYLLPGEKDLGKGSLINLPEAYWQGFPNPSGKARVILTEEDAAVDSSDLTNAHVEDIGNTEIETEMTVVKTREKMHTSDMIPTNIVRPCDGRTMLVGIISSDSTEPDTFNGSVSCDALIPLLDEFAAIDIADTSDDQDNLRGGTTEDEPSDEWAELLVPDEDGDTLLHMAIIDYNPTLALTIIQIMAQFGWDLNWRNLLFQTPLHLAVLTEQADLVRQLVENGADLTIRDNRGRTPLHIACEMRQPEMLNYLMNSRDKSMNQGREKTKPELDRVLDVKNYDGEACVHVASKCGDVKMMECLINYGANVNLADEKSGRTALHFAAENNDINMVTYLLGIGDVNVSPETLSEETPILLAYLRDFDEIVELIKKYQNK